MLKDLQKEFQERLDEIKEGFVVTENPLNGLAIQNKELKIPAIVGFGKDDEIECNNYFFILETIKKSFPEFNFTEENLVNISKIIGMAKSIIAYNPNYNLFDVFNNKTMQEYYNEMKIDNLAFNLIIMITFASIKNIKLDTYTDGEGCSYNSLELIKLGE